MNLAAKAMHLFSHTFRGLVHQDGSHDFHRKLDEQLKSHSRTLPDLNGSEKAGNLHQPETMSSAL